mmetsp:Transcript_18165/g.27242  ORF Transcript_18165/g.27242 Transcript_18165/m.27242 type:complete len:340 (+) Transcript_18165:118-1137(+)
MNQYSENLVTLSLYPTEIYDEDLTIDCGIEIDDICSEIHEACKGWGKDTKRLIKALGDTTSEERKKISIRYPEIYSKDLRKLMKDECSGDFGLAMQFLAVGPVEAECYMIKYAVDGWGADKLLLHSILCGRSNDDMILLKKTYYKLFTDDLTARIAGEVGGDLKKILLSAVQAAEEEFDPDYHTRDKAAEDAEAIYKAGQGRWGTDENKMAKIIVLSPPKYLKLINEVYADTYGYTLFKAFEKELGRLGGEAALFTLGMKLKPYETVAHLIKKATKGLGTNETLLTCNIIRYQDIMGHVYIAHEQLFEKSIHKRIVDETSGSYKHILTAVLDKAFPQYE